MKTKENKISYGRGNSLTNYVRGWVELAHDPLKPLPPVWENTEELCLAEEL